MELQRRNCRRVRQAAREVRGLRSAFGTSLDDQAAQWAARAQAAEALCGKSDELLAPGRNDSRLAAYYAVNAWGTEMMGGAECCNLVEPPHCLDTRWSGSSLASWALLGLLVCLFASSSIASLCLRPRHVEPEDEDVDTPTPPESPSGSRPRPPRTAGVRMAAELRDEWLIRSCLRVLPGSQVFADASAGLFGALYETFDFQADNIRNQFQHLISLWRSHVALVADRSVGEGVPVDEDCLLLEALADLHAELLEGFGSWRMALSVHEASKMSGHTAGLPSLGGAQWGRIDSSVCGGSVVRAMEMSAQLAEVAALLLVWGEAGNVRFMPELLYFLTELLLAAEEPGPEGLYGPGAQAVCEADPGGDFRSGLFLAKVIRPIYNVVFDEWYEKITVEENGRDKKHLLKEFERFLPPDVANYDDWNELFCEPQRLVRGLVLDDGSGLFERPHGQRFAALHELSWDVSLHRQETKTHREVHSLWGVFAATHRIWLLHSVLFFLGVCLVADPVPQGSRHDFARAPIAGAAQGSRFAAVGLLVPLHGLFWSMARWETTGSAARARDCGGVHCGSALGAFCLWTLPLVTYAALRYVEVEFAEVGGPDDVFGVSRGDAVLIACTASHYTVSLLGLVHLLLAPRRPPGTSPTWRPTSTPWYTRALRYFFWADVIAVKFLLGLMVFRAMYRATQELELTMVGHESANALSRFWYSPGWHAQVLVWLLLWAATFCLFVSDTQLWFTVGSTFLGVAQFMVQRDCAVCTFGLEDAVSKIPERFSEKVFPFAPPAADATSGRGQESGPESRAMTPYFPVIWDRVIDYMRYEDKCDNQAMGDYSFRAGDADRPVYWRQFEQPLRQQPRPPRASAAASSAGGASSSGIGAASLARGLSGTVGSRTLDGASSAAASSGTPSSASAPSSRQTGDSSRPSFYDQRYNHSVRVPDLFRNRSPLENCIKHYCCVPDPTWPTNPETQWRVLALSRGLGLPMPRPFRVPYIPGITVFIPHYSEHILMQKHQLFSGGQDEPGKATGTFEQVNLIDWVKARYEDEFRNFTNRMQAKRDLAGWPAAGSQWAAYSDHQWDKICAWASMRMQTLYRTVAGMCLYHPVLQAHYEVQRDRLSRLARPDVWNPSDCLTVLVSMQEYRNFDAVKLRQTQRMLHKFPPSLKVAYIDWQDKEVPPARGDNLHPRQRRRYFSCLIDKYCQTTPECRRIPSLKIELPGYPILGDGKSDNQNHAIPFMRGAFCQCIDSNQGAYFEQMLLLPCVLGEFRTSKRGEDGSKRIIGLPEHITSDIGSIGDFAAGSEQAFGTILQRSLVVLGARMHYGHPDIMNKHYMIQQGGVSKGTKTLNLSEDVFAGMDFVLRGGGRRIRHAEYFHLAKGRDLGFNAVLAFFSKLSMGAGEQVLTRQMYRLCQLYELPECLTFYYAHVGYYLTQALISWTMPLVVFAWLVVLAADCEDHLRAFQSCPNTPAATAIARTLSIWFSWILFLFFVATSLPLFAEVWMERSLKVACQRVLKMYCTLAWLVFIFQAKIIGYYFTNELQFGGASYVSTGRGLPTERRPFIGQAAPRSPRRRCCCCWGAERRRIAKVGGLYLDYAMHTYYDGMWLLGSSLLVIALGGANAPGISPTALASTWASLCLTAGSWIYAPFLFNPYQFNWHCFLEDIRAWRGFFFDDRGNNWVEWYDKVQLKAKPGFRLSVVGLNFVAGVFGLSVWVSVVNYKLLLLSRIFTAQPYGEIFRWVALAPPVGLSLAYCILAALVQQLLGCSGRIAEVAEERGRRRRQAVGHHHPAVARQPSSRSSIPGRAASFSGTGASAAAVGNGVQAIDLEGGGASDEEEETRRRVAEDYEVPPVGSEGGLDGGPSGRPTARCQRPISLAFSAFIVIVLEAAEACASLWLVYTAGWHKALISGLVLKFLLLEAALMMSEGLLRSRCFDRMGCCGVPLDLWVHANRMVRDLGTSAFILITLTPGVLLNTLNECLCQGCSAHQLLIYRDPGHLARKEAVCVDLLGDGATSESGGSESDLFEAQQLLEGPDGELPGLLPAAAAPPAALQQQLQGGAAAGAPLPGAPVAAAPLRGPAPAGAPLQGAAAAGAPAREAPLAPPARPPLGRAALPPERTLQHHHAPLATPAAAPAPFQAAPAPAAPGPQAAAAAGPGRPLAQPAAPQLAQPAALLPTVLAPQLSAPGAATAAAAAVLVAGGTSPVRATSHASSSSLAPLPLPRLGEAGGAT